VRTLEIPIYFFVVEPMTDLFVMLYLLAALQGLLLSAFLFTRKANHAANLVLAAATVALSVELATVAYYANGWYRVFPHAMGISYPFPFLYGPLFFLYARLMAKKQERFRAIDLLHFAPVVFIYILIAPALFYSGEEKIIFLENMIREIHDPMYDVFERLIPVQGVIYTILTVRTVAEYNRSIKDAYSDIERINLNWLKYISLGMIIIWTIVALLALGKVLAIQPDRADAILNTPLAVLIYAIGYMGLKQPEIFLDPATNAPGSQEAEKYRRSGLSNENAEDIKERLLVLMSTEKPFLGQEITLQKLAERLNVSSHNLSEVINSQLQQSYFDFINQYRVDEFKKRLADPANGQFNLLSIAFDSGFKSKGTFNAIFKKQTGMTPSEYRSTIGRQP
jgi:AraC-like DNA-binding protein